MRSTHVVLLLMVVMGLGLAVGSQFNRARNAAAVEAPSDPTQLETQWARIERDAQRLRVTESPAQSQPSPPSASASAPATLNPVKNIRIMCPFPDCHNIIVVPETMRGAVVKCSACGMLFKIPTQPPKPALSGAKN